MDDSALSIDLWRQIGITAVCGAAVGLERQLRGKPMGVRTGILVCASTAVFMALEAENHSRLPELDADVGRVLVGHSLETKASDPTPTYLQDCRQVRPDWNLIA